MFILIFQQFPCNSKPDLPLEMCRTRGCASQSGFPVSELLKLTAVVSRLILSISMEGKIDVISKAIAVLPRSFSLIHSLQHHVHNHWINHHYDSILLLAKVYAPSSIFKGNCFITQRFWVLSAKVIIWWEIEGKVWMEIDNLLTWFS